MRLHPCPAPAGPLEAAPVTALRPADDRDAGVWAGFWSGDEAYFARQTGEDGSEAWYTVVDDDAAEAVAAGPREGDAPGIPRPVTLIGRVGSNASVARLGSTRRRRA